MAEYGDFVAMWEQRLLAVAEPFLDPKPNFVEGSRMAEFEDGAALIVEVTPVAEDPQFSGFWDTDIIISYDYENIDNTENVSRVWGQILEAFGYGRDGGSALRTRLTNGRLRVAPGLGAVRYDGAISQDDGVKIFNFSAHLTLAKSA